MNNLDGYYCNFGGMMRNRFFGCFEYVVILSKNFNKSEKWNI